MISFTDEEGQELVKIARYSVESLFGLKDPESQANLLSGIQTGVFVSIHDCSGDENILRGCIGFPLPRGDFYSSLKEAAVAAATEDPRFRPISEEDLDKVIFEVSVLNQPKVIKIAKPADYLDIVRIGEDGLMLNWGEYNSILLPQVAVEYNWTVDEYLRNLCYKAGLTPEMWMNHEVRIYKFGCAIYRESEPRGLVYRVEI